MVMAPSNIMGKQREEDKRTWHLLSYSTRISTNRTITLEKNKNGEKDPRKPPKDHQ